MDTNDLSEMAYRTIPIARSIHDALKTVIGASSYEYRTEEEFLEGNLILINELIEEPEEFIDFWDLYEEISVEEFASGLPKLKEHIIKTIATPIDQRI